MNPWQQLEVNFTNMITVDLAESLLLKEIRNFGNELIPFQNALGRILSDDILADRDFPPFDRATMDGIGMRFLDFKEGIRDYQIIGTQAAGDKSIAILHAGECVEIMTGCALHKSVDTVIRYEDLQIHEGIATIKIEGIRSGQSIHVKGIDRKAGDLLVAKNTLIDATIIGILASVGKSTVLVKKLPTVCVISTGDELVEVEETPGDFKIRRSNNYMLEAALKPLEINAASVHIKDDLDQIKLIVGELINNYDVIILSGGVSMGKFDHIPNALNVLGVTEIFHGVQQRPGKPFYVGKHNNGTMIFGLPGNPVSSFFCLIRYCLPWIRQNLGMATRHYYAELEIDFSFEPILQYFVPATVSVNENGILKANPFAGNGSGDFANLIDTQAFIEFPAEETNFKKGRIFRVWPFKPII